MRKLQKLALCACLVVVLSGCAGNSDYGEFTVEQDDKIESYKSLHDMLVAPADVEEEQEETTVELPDVELEADILGIYKVSEDAGAQRDYVVSRLAPGEYEVEARILLSADAESILDQELDFLLTVPTVVEKGKKSEFTTMVFIDAVAAAMDDFAITSTMCDLRLDYIPDTYRIVRNSKASVNLATGDMKWTEDADWQEQTLEYATTINQQLGVHEYIISYHVMATALDAQQEEAVVKEEEPVSVKLKGISRQLSQDDESSKIVASIALNDCLRESYFVHESMLSEGVAYVVVEVTLPNWAREYAEQYGLALTWYNYLDAPGCGIGVSLPALPDNYGHAEASLEDLRLVPIVMDGNMDIVGMLTPYPTAAVSVWCEDEFSAFSNLAIMDMPMEGAAEPRLNRTGFTQLLGGEIVEKIPANGRFYVVMGTELTSTEKK